MKKEEIIKGENVKKKPGKRERECASQGKRKREREQERARASEEKEMYQEGGFLFPPCDNSRHTNA